ncbi:Hypothetical predicted protein [Mytilus galloprovincialis]|uniref:B box-type domain-containing protein n=1 Tax=Mytilus galloprovincialis TaxID=29158 RepID=A0A8B6CIK7_MYTGA|nr:Hypothetical predicted protein [Mytilus galloprovincialis]
MASSKSLQRGQIPVGCELCDGGNKIKFKCLDCQLLMCSRCKDKVHARFKNATEHRIRDIKELDLEEEVDTFNFTDVKCLEHPDQACCVYCQTCKKVICLKCVTKVHNGHTFIDEEELNDKKTITKSGQKKADESIHNLTSTLHKVQDIKDQEDAKFRKIKQDILSHRDAFKCKVDKHADNLVKDLEQTWELNSQEIGAKHSKIKKTLKKLQRKSNTVKSITTSKDFVKFFDDFDKFAVSLCGATPQENLEFSLLGRFLPDKITMVNFGSMENRGNLEIQHPKIEFKIAKQFTTQLRNVHNICRCSDGTLWIYDGILEKLQHIKFDNQNITIMSESNCFSICDMAAMNACTNLVEAALGETKLFIISETKLFIINSSTVWLKHDESNYVVRPYTNCTSQSQPVCVHITKDNRVIVGVGRRGTKAAVVVMGQDGGCLEKYEEDSNKEPLFTRPRLITSTNNGNICVVDGIDSDCRVLVLGKEGDIKQVYIGQPKINTEEKTFTPSDLLTTPADNIVVTDIFISTLHILNSEGKFIGHYNLHDIGIIYPCRLTLSTEGHIYVGCSNTRDSPETLKAKIYELEYSGF